jgi:phenylalanyl-tRNA synthetase beta chain
LLRSALLFDVYRPKAGTASGGLQSGEKSLAVRLTLNSDAATLTDEQIDACVQAVVDALAARCGARLRG